MQQDMNERLVLRITSSLKKSIEDLARKQNITASELVRKVLEDVVCKKEKEIEQCALMVNTIAKHINSLQEEMIFTDMPKNINRLTEEIRHYKKLSYSHQLKAIELITEEKNFDDGKTQLLRSTVNNDLETMNDFLSKSRDNIQSDKVFEVTQNRINMFEDKVWISTFKLYTHLVDKYFGK